MIQFCCAGIATTRKTPMPALIRAWCLLVFMRLSLFASDMLRRPASACSTCCRGISSGLLILFAVFWLGQVHAASTVNLALAKPAFASSQSSASLSPSRAVDGSLTTHWYSASSDRQWIYVDLGAMHTIERVALKWGVTFGKAYKIQVSTNGVNWTDVFLQGNSDGGVDDISFAATNARYVRLHGITRSSQWGYSLLEFEVYAVDPAEALNIVGFDTVSDVLWDETAVRKVLHTFAYGGQATDAQIRQWANMSPRRAIVQMLTFDQHNPMLSPVGPADYDRLDTRNGTLAGLAQFWASSDPANGVYGPHRERYDLFGTYGQLDLIWTRAANSRGLNPFRQKIGLWETNYHLATNMEVVPRRVMARYYDSILGALEAGLSYRDVLATAAKSAAVAVQYGHYKNVFVNGVCQCNEDFAREYHQLFFGILGSAEPGYHETISIKNTASSLTDMRVDRDVVNGGFVDEVVFGTERHAPGVLEIIHAGIAGSDAAQRLDELSRIAIDHPESLDHLPVMIISGLADDNLNDAKIGRIRLAWQSMSEKNLLDYLRAYAISTLFHDASRVKYRTSIDRHLLVANLITLNNEEAYLDLYSPIYGYQAEDVKAFYPTHNVFGGQTGEESSSSSDIFRNNYARVTQDATRFQLASASKYERTWTKDWSSVIPRSDAGYVVRNVAEWLWQRFVADGLKNFGPLERAHLYALLGSGMDLAYLLNPNAANRIITAAEVQSDPVVSAAVNELAQRTMTLDSTTSSQRIKANQRIGQAINFIVGTPFMFAEEGR